MPRTEEKELLDAARSGDRHAIERLLAAHQPQVYRFGLRMCRDEEDAEDVLQDTLLTMARGIGDFRGASSLSTWLFSIARSHCAKKRRRSKHAPEEVRPLEGAEVEALADPSSPADEAIARKRLEAALEGAIRSLDPKYREILILRDVEGLPAAEVAQVTGLGVAAVKSRLHRARLAIRERLSPLLEPEDTGVAAGACPDVLSLFSRHLEDELSPLVCQEMERHLEGCARCRNSCDSIRQLLSLCRSVGPSAEVPAPVQASIRVALTELLETSG